MADSKEYISQKTGEGSVNISEDVIGIIALEAMSEVEGFGGVSNTFGKDLADFIGIKGNFRGVCVSTSEDSITVDVYLSVKYGYSITKVAVEIQDAVGKAVGDMTGVEVAAVNVHVGGVTFDKAGK